jgi:hypothetical protein
MKRLAFVFSLALCSWAADRIQVERDGAFWNVIVTGSFPPQSVYRITAGGDLTVRGKHSKAIEYSINARIRGGDRAAARRAAEEFRALNVSGQLVFPQSAAVRVELPRKSSYLSLWSPGGEIDASDLTGSVRADSAAGRILLDRIAGDAEIHSSGGPTILGTIGGVVRCYSGGGTIRAVKVQGGAVFESDGGDIQLGEVEGAVRAITAAGGIRIDHAGSSVYADTFGGPISILRALGIVTARSAGGPIDVAEAPSVQCRSASGTIRLNNVSGELHAETERGSIVAEILSGRPLKDSLLLTRAGDITVFIPSDIGVTIQAECGGTRSRAAIVSDFSGFRISSAPATVMARGQVNGGGPLLRLTAAGGRIEIKRK